MNGVEYYKPSLDWCTIHDCSFPWLLLTPNIFTYKEWQYTMLWCSYKTACILFPFNWFVLCVCTVCPTTKANMCITFLKYEIIKDVKFSVSSTNIQQWLFWWQFCIHRSWVISAYLQIAFKELGELSVCASWIVNFSIVVVNLQSETEHSNNSFIVSHVWANSSTQTFIQTLK